MDELSLLLCEWQEHENNKYIEENAYVPRNLTNFNFQNFAVSYWQVNILFDRNEHGRQTSSGSEESWLTDSQFVLHINLYIHVQANWTARGTNSKLH